jgi:uncharacterized membrane protein YcaP (DUF421 family)
VIALAPVTAHVVGVQVIKTLIILTLLVVGFRVFGKREASQLNVYDLAMLMALANAVQNSMTGGLGNLPVGLATSSAILLAAFVVTRVTARRPRLERGLVGSPTLLVNHGQVLTNPMRRQRVSSEDLEAACRQFGLDGSADAELAVLEVDGSISVCAKARPDTAPAPPNRPNQPRRRRRRAGGTPAPRPDPAPPIDAGPPDQPPAAHSDRPAEPPVVDSDTPPDEPSGPPAQP